MGAKIFLTLLFLMFKSFLIADVKKPWADYPKKIIGTPAPLKNTPDYTIMTNSTNGWWYFSGYFIPETTASFKFMVQTNTNSVYYIELQDAREISIPYGTNNMIYFITNTNGIIKLKEGSQTNKYVEMYFNWEGRPDPPTGISAVVIKTDKVEVKWTYSVEMDVIGYNVYVSNKDYKPFKVNKELITTNYFIITNLALDVTNYIYVTAVDAYTNMPDSESQPSQIVPVITGSPIAVFFYLKKKHSPEQGELSIAGDTSPLDWTPTQRMKYLYNDLWVYSAKFPENLKIQYKYLIVTEDSNIWEGDFETESGNRELVIRDPDHDGIMEVYDTWALLTNVNPPPSPPTNIKGVPLNQSAYLFWNANTEIDFKEYKLYRSMYDTNDFKLITTLNTAYFTDTGLTNNIDYYYRITAVDKQLNESEPSEIIKITPSTNPPPITPCGLKGYAADNKVILTWTPNPENDINSYIIYRVYQSEYIYYTNINTTIYTDINVTNGNTYTYALRVVDLIGQTNYGFSDTVSVTPSTNPVPLKIENIELVKTSNQSIFLRWQRTEDLDISHYVVSYQQEGSIEKTVSTTNTNIVITNLENGVKTIISIYAVDTSGQEGMSSDTLEVYPTPVITNLTVLPSGTETGAVKLVFTSPALAGPLGPPVRYIIKYSTNKITSFKEFKEAPTFAEVFANYSGIEESIKVRNLGTDSPGYYFTVGAIYGQDKGLGLSDSIYQVASQVFSVEKGGIFGKIGTKLKIEIPPYALPSHVRGIVVKSYSDLVKENSTNILNSISKANSLLANYPSFKLIGNGTNLYEIYLVDAGGEEVELSRNFDKKITVKFPFNDSDHDGIIDETEGDENIKVKTLGLYYLSKNTGEWSYIPDVTIDRSDNYLIARIEHLTTFIPLSQSPASSLDKVAVFPNPAYSPDENNPVEFVYLTENAKIRIFTLAGELVRDNLIADGKGRCKWDGKNKDGEPVATGIYLFYIEDGKNEPVRGKIAIIR